jgi:hypothetical protein
MKIILLLLVGVITFNICNAQIELDLSVDKGNSRTIDLDVKYVKILNAVRNKFSYIVDIKKTTITPVFNISGAQAINGFDKNTCSNDSKTILGKLEASSTEKELKTAVDDARKYLVNNKEPLSECIKAIENIVINTEIVVPLGFKVQPNQTIVITINKYENGKKDPKFTWTFTLKTEEKTRWLVHYGLTYAPSLISKFTHYHSLADTGTANRYTIAKDNNNGPKTWENISATINFTYPFHGDERGYDAGITAGFAISAGLELSGHIGISAIIGQNVIVGSGIAFMQKQKLKGQYKEGQIIKENLSFDALHEKVWVPELFFTIGFRFGSNPFVKKEAADSKKPATTTPSE